jgi:hypothetical protein
MKTPKYQITRYTNIPDQPEYFIAKATHADGKSQASPLFNTQAEAEQWLKDYHTSFLMQRLIEVNTPQPQPA